MSENDKVIKGKDEVCKPWLKYDVGDVVFLKSDKKRQIPMTIFCFLDKDDFDYRTVWLNSRKTLEGAQFPEDVLTY